MKNLITFFLIALYINANAQTAGIINTFAGNGTAGYGGDGGAATSATLNAPFGIAVDVAGLILSLVMAQQVTAGTAARQLRLH